MGVKFLYLVISCICACTHILLYLNLNIWLIQLEACAKTEFSDRSTLKNIRSWNAAVIQLCLKYTTYSQNNVSNVFWNGSLNAGFASLWTLKMSIAGRVWIACCRWKSLTWRPWFLCEEAMFLRVSVMYMKYLNW